MPVRRSACVRALLDLLGVMRRRDRRRLALILVGLVLAALLEVVGVASVIPFLTLVGNPGAAHRVPYLTEIRDALDLGDDRAFLLATGLVALGAILLTSIVNATLTFAQLLFANLSGYALARRLLSVYISRERLFFARTNSAELAKNVLSETDRLVSGVLTPTMVIASRGTSALAVITFLLVYQPRLAFVLGAGFGGLYLLIFLAMRLRLSRAGGRALGNNKRRHRIVQETFGALTELKLYGRAQTFASGFNAPARAYARTVAVNQVTGQVPRYVIEALAFGGVIVVVLVALAHGADTAHLLPLLGLFAFAGYRMLPAFQNIYSAVSMSRFHLPAVQLVVDALKSERPVMPRTAERLPFAHEIRLSGLGFDYEPGRTTLDAIDLTIPVNATIGLVGRTGSGKSTLVGLVLGILTPTRGTIHVDGTPLTPETLPSWQNHIGYVPQDVFLIDGTVAENIAIGVRAGKIDRDAVERAARLAGIHDFVAGLPDGYGTGVGERGARLSGGQRQRIGIARALYHDPDVIVFDEATSALDGETEAAVMAALGALSGRRTIIMIAHRLTSLRHADTVHVLEAGRLIASGPPEAVIPTLAATPEPQPA